VNPQRDRKLTPRQKEVLDWIRAFIQRERMAPTLRELCSGFGFSSTQGASCHLQALEEKGFLTHKKGCPRSILLKAGDGSCSDLYWDVARIEYRVAVRVLNGEFWMTTEKALEFAKKIIEEASR
jgi:SOS-response transcriptional repressor LexA